MNRRNVAASTTTTLRASRATSTPLSPAEKVFVRSMMERHSFTEQEVINRCIRLFGSVKSAMEATEYSDAAIKEAKERSYDHIQAKVGRKPNPGEEVTFSRVRAGLMIRVWGGDLASYAVYCFDFVNDERKHIRAPEEVKIYSVATAYCPSMPVLSIEQSLKRSVPQHHLANESHEGYDPEWETYIVPEGTILRIEQPLEPDSFLHIPMRTQNGARTLVLQPW